MHLALEPINRSVKSISTTVTAPVGGWNARDSLVGMPPQDAILMDNLFPREGYVEIRQGCAVHSTSGQAGPVETLAELHIGATRKLIGATSGKIYDFSVATAVELASGYSQNRWQTTTFGNRLFACNGIDAPWDYDGTTFTTTAWTGVPSNNSLTNVLAFKNRLYFVERNSQTFWYGGVDAVSGALASFDLSFVTELGGTLVALVSITRDGGDGPDDLFCAIMSSGEVVVYSGSDPGDANNWAIVGRFEIAEPLGLRCTLKVGSDVIVPTKAGYVPLGQVLPIGRASTNIALSDKIKGAVSEAITAYGNNTGWQAVLYPAGDKLIINVPTGGDSFVQHVMNTNTLAWCRFTGLTSYAWSLFNEELFFGGPGGTVLQADTTLADVGKAVQWQVRSAWNYFGDASRVKRFNAVLPLFESQGPLSASLQLRVDFDNTPPVNLGAPPTPAQAANDPEWDSEEWDSVSWPGQLSTSQDWQTVDGIGRAASIWSYGANIGQVVRWVAISYIYEPGEYL